MSTSEELLVIGCYLMGVCVCVCSYQYVSTNTFVNQPRHANGLCPQVLLHIKETNTSYATDTLFILDLSTA